MNEIITVEHGSGGFKTNELINKIFSKHFANEILDKMEDAAVLKVAGKIAITTDSFVVTPLFYPGGDIGRLAVCGTVNDIVMMGARPQFITAAFIIEEGMDTDTLEQIVISMAKTAKESGVAIVAGDTKVIEGNGGLYITTTGIGKIIAEQISAANCKPGDAVILSGTLGDHHACILSARMGIANNIVSDNVPLVEPVMTLINNGINIRAMRDITRGGLGTILNEFAKSSGVSICIEEEKISVSESVSGLCDILGLDPIYMGNEGKFIAVVAKEDAETAVELLKQNEISKNACIIGHITSRGIDSKDNTVTMITPNGASRRISIMHGEGLPRIC